MGEHATTINTATDPAVLSAAAAWAERLLSVPGAEPVKRALAVAERHIAAGWAEFDAWRYDRLMYHFTTALTLAIEVGDAYRRPPP